MRLPWSSQATTGANYSAQTSPIPNPLPCPVPQRLRILRRCNIFLSDSASNFRIPQLQQQYDLVAARPTDERTLQQACHSLDVDIISLDLTRRFEKHFKFPMLGAAVRAASRSSCATAKVYFRATHKRSATSSAMRHSSFELHEVAASSSVLKRKVSWVSAHRAMLSTWPRFGDWALKGARTVLQRNRAVS